MIIEESENAERLMVIRVKIILLTMVMIMVVKVIKIITKYTSNGDNSDGCSFRSGKVLFLSSMEKKCNRSNIFDELVVIE